MIFVMIDNYFLRYKYLTYTLVPVLNPTPMNDNLSNPH